VRGVVEGGRQLQHVLEVAAHRGQPTALAKAVGVQCNQNTGADASDSDRAPNTKQDNDLPPALVSRTRAAVGNGIDDATEQDGTGEGGGGERDIGHDQRGRETSFGREQACDAPIKP
jgi:hypothetical protein